MKPLQQLEREKAIEEAAADAAVEENYEAIGNAVISFLEGLVNQYSDEAGKKALHEIGWRLVEATTNYMVNHDDVLEVVKNTVPNCATIQRLGNQAILISNYGFKIKQEPGWMSFKLRGITKKQFDEERSKQQ